MSRADVVIAGGGFSGLVTAVACAARGMDVEVLEARAGALPTFRGELLHPPAVRALDELDLGPALFAAGATRIAGFAAFASPRSDPTILPYPTGEGMVIGHEALLTALRENLRKLPNVNVVQGRKVVDVLREQRRVVGLRSHGGELHRAEVVVVADGRHSALRKLLGIRARASLLSYTGRLPCPQSGHVFIGAPGPVLAYPYGSRRTRLCIDVPLFAPRGRRALAEYLEGAFVPHLPEALRSPVATAARSSAIELCANHFMYTDRCVVDGAALVGDAAGCSHPLTATGMTIALHDALLLAGCLSDRGSLGARLKRFQRRRYHFARARDLFSQALYGVFRADSSGARALCDGVFRYWQAGELSRTASMNILTGEESSALRFFVEYAKVVGPSSMKVCEAALRARSLDALQPLRSIIALLGASLDGAIAQRSAALRRELSWPRNERAYRELGGELV
jgi:squalene monooxygenase